LLPEKAERGKRKSVCREGELYYISSKDGYSQRLKPPLTKELFKERQRYSVVLLFYYALAQNIFDLIFLQNSAAGNDTACVFYFLAFLSVMC